MAKQKGTSGKPSANGAAPPAEPERLPAYFLSLTLENVRCFGPKQTLDLSDGNGKPARWTVILGLNGTGKTTLLQSLVVLEGLVIVGTSRRIYRPRLFEIGCANYPFGRGSSDQEHEAPASLSIRVARTPSIIDPPTRVTEEKVTNHGTCEVPVFTLDSFTDEGGPWCCAYGAGRNLGTASMYGTGSHDTPTGSLFSNEAELRNPEEWLLELDYAAVKAAKHDTEPRNRLALAKELLLNILPDIADIRFTTTGGPNPKARAEFQTFSGWVPLRQLGYGYQTLITWVADLANRMAERYPDSKNPLAEPAVVLVDEIDLHLHPIWQRKLIGFLTERFPNTQFIATAHSPLVAQAAADANLAVLRREGDHVVIDNEVDNIRNWRIDQILTSDLFGLKSARPPHIEADLLERKTLLTKPKLTAGDKRRLEELEAKIGPLPTGDSTQEVKEREEIRKTLELLMKERKPAS